MSTIIAATNARSNFFEILNKVLYGGETIFISKAGSNNLVKVEAVPSSSVVLNKLAGSISNTDAVLMEKAMKKVKDYPKREISNFDE